jgi:hypothetical protein
MKIRDLFWYNDPSTIIDPNRLSEFIPTSLMTRVEQLNAVVRFSLYLSIILILMRNGDFNYIIIFLSSLLVTYIIYTFDDRVRDVKTGDHQELFTDLSKPACTNYIKPTYDNPFMNPTLIDITENPNREAYSKKSFLANDEIKMDIEDKFSYNLYQDADDIFGTRNSRREFYTVPVTTIPSNQDSFAKWLYGNPATCKDGNGLQCEVNNNRHLMGESRPVFY